MSKTVSKFALVASVLLAMALTLSSCAPSAAKQAIISAVSVEEVTGLSGKLTWLQTNAKSGGSYILEINSDEELDRTCGGFITFCNDISYKNRKDITIILKSAGESRITGSNMRQSGFKVGSGVTLVLDSNITLQGGKYFGSLVIVEDGGTLVMNDGSTITGGREKEGKNGGGVHVSNGGTFIMKGGTIYKNSCAPDYRWILGFNKAMENNLKNPILTEPICYGGGVYVSNKGTFVKTGGTIIGYASDPENGNVVYAPYDGQNFSGFGIGQSYVDKPSYVSKGEVKGEAVNNSGHAIYFAGSEGKEPRSIDNTVGPEMNLNFSNGTFSEVRNEELKETITQSDGPEKIQVQDYAEFSRKEKEANEKEEKEIQSSFNDPRDGKTYKTVKIGSQTWMAENLNYNASDSKCYDNKPANCEIYGRLYGWNTALKACPSGWHLPSIYEYEALDNTVGGEVFAGKKLKASSGWNKDGKSTDEFGFSALPGGFGISSGSFGRFGSVGNYGYWWNATEYDSYNAYYRGIGYNDSGVSRKDIDKPFLFSVRCLQD